MDDIDLDLELELLGCADDLCSSDEIPFPPTLSLSTGLNIQPVTQDDLDNALGLLGELADSDSDSDSEDEDEDEDEDEEWPESEGDSPDIDLELSQLPAEAPEELESLESRLDALIAEEATSDNKNLQITVIIRNVRLTSGLNLKVELD